MRDDDCQRGWLGFSALHIVVCLDRLVSRVQEHLQTATDPNKICKHHNETLGQVGSVVRVEEGAELFSK